MKKINKNERLTLQLTPHDLLVVEYDRGDICGNEYLSFAVQNKIGGTYTHLGTEELIPIITTYAPELTTRQVVKLSLTILLKVGKFLETCEQPHQEPVERDTDMDVQEAKLEEVTPC